MRILAVDLGDVRTGLAICDIEETLAYPLEVIHERERGETAKKVAAAAVFHKADMVIVGHPKNRDGSLGERARISEEFAEALGLLTGLPVDLWDERGTTISAQAALNFGTTKPRKKKAVIDAVAATILLESFLAYRRGRPGTKS